MNQQSEIKYYKGRIRAFALGELAEEERSHLLQKLSQDKDLKDYLDEVENELNLLDEHIPFNTSNKNTREEVESKLNDLMNEIEISEKGTVERVIGYLSKLGS